ncbi:hypothetical protein DXN04_00600 [Chitinophaga silvisoli]|uniref:Uncharacterized protein n=1 Tax=Chitinophaga silvisoli TaxID=2291814 RepID=A0A3E1P782_9BACT|nr:hypothetical protein DXN04_00600 [Chitinophaga silvisoli]
MVLKVKNNYYVFATGLSSAFDKVRPSFVLLKLLPFKKRKGKYYPIDLVDYLILCYFCPAYILLACSTNVHRRTIDNLIA